METSLHQQLKQHYAADPALVEVTLGRYRIDAVRDDELIEVQCASLAAIRDKCQRLLQRHPLRVVKPVVLRTRIAKVKRRGGKVLSRRYSPRRGSPIDLFDELIYFTQVFPHPQLTIDVPLICVEQVRGPAERRPRRWRRDFQVHDVSLLEILGTVELKDPADLLALVNLPGGGGSFNTADLARALDRPRWHAQQIAYVLRKTGALAAIGRTKGGILYRPAA